jgi:ADP-dependent phosphofructokinase/glucokinase
MGESIVLGLGDNTDYEIEWSSSTLESLVRRFDIRADELDPDIPVSSMRALVISILGFLRSGSGGERFVGSSEIIEDFARLFAKRVTVGGTSIRAAIAMRKLGNSSALHLVTINEQVRRLIPPDCPWICSAREDSSYPHLIMQYNAGAAVRVGGIDITPGRANRIIYDNDPDNIRMELSPGLADLASEARVFLISGFNAMRSPELLSDRLEGLVKVLESLPPETLVYYEDACFHDKSLNILVREALLDKVDFFSLNEDEARGYLGRELDILDPRDVEDALERLRRILPGPNLVVHTQYWAGLLGPEAGRCVSALRGGIVMATTRLRFGDDFGMAEYEGTASLPIDEAGGKFAADLESSVGGALRCLPSFRVEESDLTTIGLGDAFVGGFLRALVEHNIAEKQGALL